MEGLVRSCCHLWPNVDSIQEWMVEQRLGHTLMKTFNTRLITGSARLQ